MTRLHHFEAPVLIPLIKEIQEKCGQPDQSDVDYCLSQVDTRLKSDKGAVFVDDVGQPHAVAVVYLGDSLFKPGTICHVMAVYIQKEHRTPAIADEIIRTCLDYAREKKCFLVHGSSWSYRGVTAGIGAAWERFGFEKQEEIYTLKL